MKREQEKISYVGEFVRWDISSIKTNWYSYNLFFSCVTHTYLNVSSQTNKIGAEKNL